MPRYDLALHVEVEAESAEAAWAYVRTNYGVIDDPKREITTHGVDFFLDEDAAELGEDESFFDSDEDDAA